MTIIPIPFNTSVPEGQMATATAIAWILACLIMYVTAGIMSFKYNEDDNEFYQKFPKRHERLCIRIYYIIFWPLIDFIKFIMFLFK